MSSGYAIETLGENALLLRFGDDLDLGLNARVHAAAAALAAERPRWLLDIVPAFATLGLCFDPAAFADACEPVAEVRSWLSTRSLLERADLACASGRAHVIPVRYGGEHGPDLEAVARHAGISPEQVVRRHAAAVYRVGMLGFAAGFPYLLGMPAELAMPRRSTPRTAVAAGSVAIGGAQTGIYPRGGPGGWLIIGRTDTWLFDAGRDPPTLLQPGDEVRFEVSGLDVERQP